MAVMLIAEIAGSTREQQQGMVDQLESELRSRPGFLFHAGGPTEQGWRLHEVWETREQLEEWLQQRVLPSLPAEAPQPDMRIVPIEIHISPNKTQGSQSGGR